MKKVVYGVVFILVSGFLLLKNDENFGCSLIFASVGLFFILIGYLQIVKNR